MILFKLGILYGLYARIPASPPHDFLSTLPPGQNPELVAVFCLSPWGRPGRCGVGAPPWTHLLDAWIPPV